MAHYSSSGLSFLPGPGHTAAATTSALTPKIWDKILHEQVQNKSFWKNMTGKDKAGEGSLDNDISNFPIVQKTDLKKSSGDRIRVGLVKAVNLTDETTFTYWNYGKVTGQELIDAESSLTFYYQSVPVALYRDGVLIENEMSFQNSPFDLQKVAVDALSNKLNYYRDSGFFSAFYAKYSPEVVRTLASASSVAHPNMLYGKNKTALTEVDSNDLVDCDLLERLAVYQKINHIAPIGDGQLMFIVHPYGTKTLRADSAWFDAQKGAAPRSKENAIFTGEVGNYAGIHLFEDTRISSAKEYGSLTITTYAVASAFTASSMGNIAATDARMNLLIGANAMTEAFAKETFMRRRKEDDYGEKSGFGGGFIRGAMRADYLPDMSSSTTAVNQSSAVIYSYSPSPIGNVSAIW